MNNTVRNISFTHLLISISCIFFIIACLKMVSGFLVPIIISIFLSSVCLSIAFWLKTKFDNYIIAVLLAFAFLSILIFTIFNFLSLGISQLLDDLPRYKELLAIRLENLQEYISHWTMKYGLSSSDALDINKYLYLFINWATSLGETFTNVGIVLIITFFAVFEGINISRKFSQAFEKHSFSQIKEIIKMVNDYLWIKSTINIISGFIVAIILSVFGVKHAVLFGLLVFLLNYIPAIGIILAGIIPTIIAWIDYGVGLEFALILSLYIVVNLVLSVVEPKITGDKFGLSGLFVILSLIFWSWLFGSVGMFLAVPLTMIIKITAQTSEKSKWLSTIMS